MGYYTALITDLTLRDDAPEPVRATLRFMIGENEDREAARFTHDHPLFKTNRWTYMLVCDSTYTDSGNSQEFDGRHLRTRSSFKNYDGEIRLFIDWIRPFVPSGSVSHRGEEAEEWEIESLGGDPERQKTETGR